MNCDLEAVIWDAFVHLKVWLGSLSTLQMFVPVHQSWKLPRSCHRINRLRLYSWNCEMLKLAGLWNEGYCGPTHVGIKIVRVGIKQQAEEAGYRRGEWGRRSGRSGDEGSCSTALLDVTAWTMFPTIPFNTNNSLPFICASYRQIIPDQEVPKHMFHSWACVPPTGSALHISTL